MKAAAEKIRIPRDVNDSLSFLKRKFAHHEKPMIIGKDISWEHIIRRVLQILIWHSVWKEGEALIYVTAKNRDRVRKTPVLELILKENSFLRRTKNINFGKRTIDFRFREEDEGLFKKLMNEFNLPSKENVIFLCLLLVAQMIEWEGGKEKRSFYVLKRPQDKGTAGRLLFGVLPMEDTVVRSAFPPEDYARYKLKRAHY